MKIELNLIKAKDYKVTGKSANALFTMIVGLRPELYLRGRRALVEGEQIALDRSPDSELLPRVQRLEYATKKARLANIAALAGEQLDENADPEGLNANWRERFVSHASAIGDAEMHQAWGRILAGEVNAPGSFSIRAIATVAEMQHHDAKTFGELCQFTWRFGGEGRIPGEPIPVVVGFGVPNTPLHLGVSFHTLKDLEAFGLISIGGYTIGARAGGGRAILEHCGDPKCTVTLDIGDDAYDIPMGEVSFTSVGRQLARIVDVTPPKAKYVEACFGLWRERAVVGGYEVAHVTRGGPREG